MAGGVVGDPYITTLFGYEYQFHGADGASCRFLEHESLTVEGRIKAIEVDKTYIDRITVKTGAHTVQVDVDGVLIDGHPPLDCHRLPGLFVWVQDQDRTIAVGHSGWLITVFRDPGLFEIHQAGPLRDTEHLAVYVDEPEGFQGATGVLVDGFQGEESKYEV